MTLTLAGGAAVAGAVALAPRPAGRRTGCGRWGCCWRSPRSRALSVVWSVQPDESWQEAGRMLAYSALFAAAVALVRVAPTRWSSVLGGVLLAAVVVCAYALRDQGVPRPAGPGRSLRAPARALRLLERDRADRRDGGGELPVAGRAPTGHALLGALAYPAMGLLLVTLMLSYSRGALVAVARGCGAVVLRRAAAPARRRRAARGRTGGGGGGGWDFSQHALSSESVALANASNAGSQLGRAAGGDARGA